MQTGIPTSTPGLSTPWPAKPNELPKEIFHREDIFQLELERIFRGPVWHMVGHVAELPKLGDFKTTIIGDVRLLMMHGKDGQVRVFHNSCPHRGTQLETAARGCRGEIECPYHRWVFNMEGALVSASGRDRFPSTFRNEDYGLRPLKTELRHGLIFSTFSDLAPPLDDFLGPADEVLRQALGGDEQVTLLGYQKVVYHGNWKECSDNEGYHAPLLHRAFRLLKWQGGKGTQAVSPYGHKTISAELAEAPKGRFLNDPSLIELRDPSRVPRSFVVQLFPLNVFVRHLDVINMRVAFPLSPHATEVHYAYFSRQEDDGEMRSHRRRQAANLLGPSGFISLEDGAVFDRLHEGSYTPGTVAFQKGVTDDGGIESVQLQNDEASNLLKWGVYQSMMGFTHD